MPSDTKPANANPELAAFLDYAQAFEVAYAADDWSYVDRRLAEDVVWSTAGAPPPYGGTWTGNKDTLAAIEASVGSFDRRFDAREPHILVGPTPIPGRR